MYQTIVTNDEKYVLTVHTLIVNIMTFMLSKSLYAQDDATPIA